MEKADNTTIQSDTKEEDLQTPLKGILKNPHEIIIDGKFIKERLTIVCLILLCIVIIIPIVICGFILWIY
jgi:hypothetical protein